jgi:hypothetical protein
MSIGNMDKTRHTVEGSGTGVNRNARKPPLGLIPHPTIWPASLIDSPEVKLQPALDGSSIEFKSSIPVADVQINAWWPNCPDVVPE